MNDEGTNLNFVLGLTFCIAFYLCRALDTYFSMMKTYKAPTISNIDNVVILDRNYTWWLEVDNMVRKNDVCLFSLNVTTNKKMCMGVAIDVQEVFDDEAKSILRIVTQRSSGDFVETHASVEQYDCSMMCTSLNNNEQSFWNLGWKDIGVEDIDVSNTILIDGFFLVKTNLLSLVVVDSQLVKPISSESPSSLRKKTNRKNKPTKHTNKRKEKANGIDVGNASIVEISNEGENESNIIELAPKSKKKKFEELCTEEFISSSVAKLSKFEKLYPLGLYTTVNIEVERCEMPPPQFNCRPFNKEYCVELQKSFLTTPGIVPAPADVIPFWATTGDLVHVKDKDILRDRKSDIRFYIVDGQHTIQAAKTIMNIIDIKKPTHAEKLKKCYKMRKARILSHLATPVDCVAISRALNEVNERYQLKSSHSELLLQARKQWEYYNQPARPEGGGRSTEEWKV